MLSQFVFVLKIKIKCGNPSWEADHSALARIATPSITPDPADSQGCYTLPPAGHLSMGPDYVLSRAGFIANPEHSGIPDRRPYSL